VRIVRIDIERALEQLDVTPDIEKRGQDGTRALQWPAGRALL